MKKCLLLLVVIFASFNVQAQKYVTAGGIRLGTEIGLTIQQAIYKQLTLELIMQSSFQNKINTITILGERHTRILTRRINFYMGGGFHKGWVDQELNLEDPSGITLIGGVEFAPSRLVISWDYKPAFNIWGGEKVISSETAFSLRYVFIKRKRKKINWKFWEKGKKKK